MSFISHTQELFLILILADFFLAFDSFNHMILLETFSFSSTYTMSSDKMSFIPYQPFSAFFAVFSFLVYSQRMGFPQASNLSPIVFLAGWSCVSTFSFNSVFLVSNMYLQPALLNSKPDFPISIFYLTQKNPCSSP